MIKDYIDALSNFKLRSQARKELVKSGPDQAGQQLLDYIKNDELKDNAVWAVVAIFHEWGWSGATDGLVELLKGRVHLRGDISRSLSAITGKDFGLDPEDWKIGLSGSEFYVELKHLFGESEISEFSIREDHCKIIVKLDNDRKQQVLLFTGSGNMRLYTECGVINEAQKPMVETMNNSLEHATLLCEAHEDCYKVTLTAPVNENSEAGALKGQVMEFAAIADTWEAQLTGQDNI